MSDTPQRANAAQIAQRNLKALKGPRRPRPMGASPQPQQQQPFALPSQQGQQGGLFGGGIQAPSDFNFSASGPSFPQVSFGSSNSFGSNTSSSDNERGGKEEEDARRNPDFHKKKGNGDNDPPLFAPMPQEAQQQLQGYMQNTAQDINNPFIFGHNNDQQISTQPAASNPFAPKPSLQTNAPFSFGSTSTSTQPPSSNIFGAPASQPTQPSSNPFSFGASQPAQSPANPFTFGQSANQTATSQAPSSGFSFTASTPAQPAANPFSFGAQSSAPSAPSAPGFSFTASTPAKPEANPFSFGQTSTKPTEAPAAPFTFGSPQPSQTEANKPVASSTPSFTFGSTQPQSPKPTNLFGSSTQQTPAPTANGLFGSRSQSPAAAPPTAPTASTKNIFGESNGGLFGKSQGTTPAPKNLFGESSNSIFSAPTNTTAPTSAATTSNLFGPRSQSPVAANLFGNRSESPAAAATTTGKNLFEKSTQPPAPTTNTLFGNRSESPASTPTNNLFGASSQKPATPAASTPSLFDRITPAPEPKATTPSLFDRISKDSNGNVIRQQPSDEKENTQPSNGNIFGNANQASTSMFGQKPQSTSNLFGGPVQQPTASSNNSFDHLNQPVNQLDVSSPPKSFMPAATSNGNSLFGTTSQPATLPGPLSNGNNSFSPRKPVDAPSSASQPPPNGMFPSLPSGNTPAASNDLFGKPSPSKSSTQPGGSSDTLANSIEPKEVDSTAPRHSLFAPADIPDEVIRPYMPSAFTGLQEKEFMSKYRMRALNKTIQQAFRDIPLGMDPAPVLEYYYQQRNKIIVGGEKWFQPSKRKFFDESEENTNPSKRARQEETVPDEPVASPPEPTQPRGYTNGAATSPFKPAKPSTTTNGKTTSPLKSRHISPPQVPAQASSPPKSQPHINGSTTPRAPPPFANPPPSASPSKGKRKAEYQITDQDPEGKGAEERRMKQPKLNGSVGSETSNIFKNILDSPSKAPEKKAPGRLETLEKNANKDAPRANPFASIPVPGSPSKSALSTASPAPATMFAPKAAASPFKPAVESNGTKPASNMFDPKPAVLPATTSTTEPIKPPTFAIKPPSFGNGPVNFLAQFGQQAKKDEKDNEEKLMEKAKEEDMDSDDDEAEWEANYKEKRKAELKELEELANSKRASFVAGKGFTFGEASKASEPAKESPMSTPAKPLFGQSTASGTATKSVFDTPPATNSGASIFGSANPSRSSTPGSVLDSHTPGKAPGQLGGIFGYLSNTGSPASGKDDESDDGADAESDSENKDPTYQPAEAGSETGSGPTTPVEKTGAGIASAKKANPFSFGSSTPSLSSGKPLFGQTGPTSVPTSNGLFSSTSTSTTGTGTSTPSLFDRISKDSDGNPIRQIPTEEKENTQPSVTNIFGGNNNPFAKGPTSVPAQSAGENQSSSKTLVGADKTWKPDSPIRFGDSASNGTTTAPAVSVTEATPTKSSNPFGGLFGSSTTPKPAAGATGSLFGNSTATKAGGSVGFAFGQSSGASSLFPSTTTSRDPSPGQTTDGDSAAEGSNDPDAEHHEQIDLTKGGPGEEDEELLHEVRAKAMKFEAKEAGDKTNPWATKGVGPLRVLKHKETKASRILLRADPSGTIVLNKGILAGVNYVATAKTVKLLTASDNGSGLETYLLQVKTPEFAKALAEVLEANKSST